VAGGTWPSLLAALIFAAGCSGGSAPPAQSGEAPAASGAPAAPVAPPHIPTPEEKMRAELETWKDVPYLENGKTRTGIGNAGFVSQAFRGAFGLDIPSEYADQLHFGKLVERDKLEPGDLVFFEGQGFGPFRSHLVAIYVASGEVALATREQGISVVKMSDAKWNPLYKTGRHIPRDPSVGAPNFDASKYGSDRAALLRDIAKAWSGTLYKQGGTTFDGIGNDEFVRNIYEAIYDTELEGTPAQWTTMGDAVPKDKLEPGDIILYQAVGIGSVFGQKHAGMYIGNGEFVHSVKGAAVTISRLDEDRWSQAYRMARRIDPDVLTRLEEARAAAAALAAEAAKTKTADAERARASAAAEADRLKSENAANTAAAPSAPAKPSSKNAKTRAPAAAATSEPVETISTTKAPAGDAAAAFVPSDEERRLREAVKPWFGTPYKWGGETKAGVDCSAFVRAIYQTVYGVQLPRTADVQEDLPSGVKIKREDLQAGDLVFFRTQGMGPFFKSRHVGIYVGNGEFAQSSGKHGVVISRLDNYYWNKKYEGARRLPPHVTTTAATPGK